MVKNGLSSGLRSWLSLLYELAGLVEVEIPIMSDGEEQISSSVRFKFINLLVF